MSCPPAEAAAADSIIVESNSSACLGFYRITWHARNCCRSVEIVGVTKAQVAWAPAALGVEPAGSFDRVQSSFRQCNVRFVSYIIQNGRVVIGQTVADSV